MSRSRSTATTRAPRATSRAVRWPSPAPSSTTRSPGRGAASRAMSERISSSPRKFCPQLFFARSPYFSSSARGDG